MLRLGLVGEYGQPIWWSKSLMKKHVEPDLQSSEELANPNLHYLKIWVQKARTTIRNSSYAKSF